MGWLKATACRQYSASPISVEHVHLDGVVRTKHDGLVTELRDIFSAKTFGELVNKAYDAKMHMQSVGLFDSVVVMIDLNRQNPSKFDVIFDVHEPSRFKGGVNLGVSSRGEANAGIEMSSESMFGRGERLSVDAQQGQQGSSFANLTFAKPILGTNSSVLLNLSRTLSDFALSGYSWRDKSAGLEFKHSLPFGIIHSIRYDAAFREVRMLHRNVDFIFREFAGHSFKSSVRNTFQFSTQDSTLLARRGVFAQAGLDYAGLGGDVNFLRSTAEFRASATTLFDTILSVGCNATLVHPLAPAALMPAAPNPRALSVIDRVFLGGPTNLRGFAIDGVTPTREIAGGLASWSAAIHLYRSLPLMPDVFYAHLFAIVGSIAAVPAEAQVNTLGYLWGELTQRPRASFGVGLAMKFGQFLRAELNYCVPMSVHPHDRIVPGVQIGVGVNFL